MIEQVLPPAVPGRPRVRVGMLLDSLATQAATAEVIARIAECEFVEIVRVVTRAAPAAPLARQGLVGRLLTSKLARQRFSYSVYDAFDRRTADPTVDPWAPADVSAVLAGVPTCAATITKQGSREHFDAATIETLAADRLDVLFRFGFGIIDGDILRSAAHGVWSFHHGDSERYRGAPPGLWELIEGNAESGAVLQVLSAELDAGGVIGRGIFETQRGLSATKNRLRPYWGTTDLAIVALHRLHRDGWPGVAALMVPIPTYRGARKIYKAPHNMELARWVMQSGAQWATSRVLGRRPIDQEWELAIRPLGSGALGDGASYTPLAGAAGRFFADPCAVHDGDTTWVFFEDWRWDIRRGHISVGRISPAGELVDVRPVMVPNSHLSFPHVFQHAGSWYMVPESIETHEVALWRATQFPDVWTKECVLYHGDAVDTTLHRGEDGWHVFTSLVEPRSGAMWHCLFGMREFGEPWTWHPASPLSTTLHGIRAAGPLVTLGDQLIRPVQDSRLGYGIGLEWRAVTSLTSEHLMETVMDALRPPAHRDGGHSYTTAGGWEIIDWCWNRPRRSRPGTDHGRSVSR
jgi:hypothetical protein